MAKKNKKKNNREIVLNFPSPFPRYSPYYSDMIIVIELRSVEDILESEYQERKTIYEKKMNSMKFKLCFLD